MTHEMNPSIVNTKLAYSFEEAAEATGYSAATIRMAVRNHNLIARYANSKPVIRTSELDEWLQSLPTEPKGGHRPVSQLVDAGRLPEAKASEDPHPSAQESPAKPLFRTPEEVAPELGISKSALRQYCRTSGIHTRVGKNRIMLHADDIEKLVAWVRDRKNAADDWAAEPEIDPFGKRR